MADQTPENSPDFRTAAAASVTPDDLTAKILAKHAAGQPLTPQESGKLGWWRSQLNRLTRKPGAPGAAPGQAQPGAAGGNAVSLAAMVSGEAPADRLAPVPCDPRLVQRTTAALLKSGDNIARRYVAREARKAGADDKALGRFDSAAALPAATQELMVETSPDVLAAMGMDPRNYPMVVFFGALGLWGTNLWLCVDDLKRMQEEKKKAETATAAAAPAPAPAQPLLSVSIGRDQVTPARGPSLPDPPRPAGAPPIVTGGNPS